MPRAWAVEDLTADMPLSQAASLILQVKLPEVLHYERGVIRGSVNSVHDMRIASKRLREAVRVLKPAIPAKDRARLLPTVEQLNDLLGEVRDRDVLRGALEKLAKEAPETSLPPKLLRQLKRERQQHHAAFVEFFQQLRASDFEVFYDRLMKRMLKAKPGQENVLHFADEAVGERLQAVMDNMQVVYRPTSVTAFHRQRIRVKKLKYALEPFLTILPPSVKPVYALIGDLQELMGLVHDADVQMALLEDWWEEHEEAGEAVDAATALLQKRRKELLQETVKHARQMRKEKFDEKLRQALQQPLPS